MQFFEQLCNGRTVLSPRIEPNAQRVTDDVDAPCWLEAKRMIGYGLSPIQEHLLERFYERRDAYA